MPKSTRTIKLPASKTAKPTLSLAALSTPAPLAAASTAQQAAGRSNVAKPVSVAANVLSATKPSKAQAKFDNAVNELAAVANVLEKRKAEKPADTAPRGLTRDAAGIVAQRTNFDTYSDRDSAYLRFFGGVCRANGGKATLVQIHNAGVPHPDAKPRDRFNPHYIGSSKATDVGAINRQIKAGHFTKAPDGTCITPTALALSSKLYHGKA